MGEKKKKRKPSLTSADSFLAALFKVPRLSARFDFNALRRYFDFIIRPGFWTFGEFHGAFDAEEEDWGEN